MEDFLERVGITYLTQDCGTEFDNIQQSHTGLHRPAQPAIITLPETAAQVAAIVKQCIATNHHFIVRGGGHDCHGRFTTSDAVSIDLRNMNSITIAPDRKTAIIGGGTTMLQVLTALEDHGLHAPSALCGDVGYAGWCLIGGFGPWTNRYGLGSDQIDGAIVVDASGELVEADGRLLKGLRGGGGCLAVVVELVIKVYPIEEVRAVTVIYETEQVYNAVFAFFTNLGNLLRRHSVPAELSIQPFYVDKGPPNPFLAVDFVWTGPLTQEYDIWLQHVTKLGPLKSGIPHHAVAIQKTTIRDFVTLHTQNLARTVVGRTHAVSITHYSPQVADVLADMASTLPKGSVGGFGMHDIGKASPSCSSNHPDSVAPYRTPQVIVEILGFGADEISAPACVAWALQLRNKLAETEAALPVSYLALTAPEFAHLEEIYGDNWDELESLKKEYDPTFVFRHTLPKVV